MIHPHRIHWSRDEDLRCAILGAMGFSTQFIEAETGLSKGQISYRLRKGVIKRSDYRNGDSEMARRILDRSVPQSPQTIRSVLNLKSK